MKFIRVISPLILMIILLVSCKSSQDNPYGYDTDAISKLQKEVPFVIVVPSYFPQDIIPYPAEINGPSQIAFSNSVGFGLVYRAKKGIKSYISIEEDGNEATYSPSKTTSVFLDISGIQVLVEETIQLTPSKTNQDPQEIKGYFYGWYNKEASIEVRIYGYDQGECRKVVESMIK